jgi:hypothetical protein
MALNKNVQSAWPHAEQALKGLEQSPEARWKVVLLKLCEAGTVLQQKP